MHDLRHYFASRALALGESLPMIGKLLGHAQVETTARYAHLSRDSVREAAERENGALALIQIVKLKRLEIAHQDVAGFFSFGQGVEVFPRLSVGFRQIAARAFLLHDQNARPEQVDVPVGIIQPPYVLLIARDGAALDAEDMEELVIKTLRLALFIRRASPCAGEARRAHAHLVPG